jgi:RNA polymerase sigma-70 factor (ECF subfamily)
VRREDADTADDIVLVRAVLASEPWAWPAFMVRFERLIVSCIRKALGCYGARAPAEELEDLISAVCFNLVKDDYRKLRLFDPDRGYRLSSWVGLIATNTVIDALRRRDPRHLSLDDPGAPALDVPTPARGPHELLEGAEEVRALERALAELSPSDRLFLEYTLDYELDPTVIARQMRIAVATVYSRKNKLREKLRRIVHRILAEGEGRIAPTPRRKG